MKGICKLAAIPMRFEPSDKAEMVNQVLYGECFEILENQEKWSKIRLVHDGYEGWIDNKQWHVTNDTDLLGNPLNKLTLVSKKNEPCHVLSMGSLIQGNKTITAPKRIMLSARQFLGVPYLWGGRTCMGIDCSGFTQIVFRVNGKQIPRDAWQQAEIGRNVRIGSAKEGDLAFFKNEQGRIIHVGIVFKENDQLRIIHASGEVRIDRLDEKGIIHEDSKKYTHTLHAIKRIKK